MSTIKVDTIQKSNGVEVYTAKSWVRFVGTGAVTINAAGNVSSISDLGVGSYQANFTTANPDANYSVSGTARYGASTNNFLIALGGANGTGTYTSTAIQVDTATGTTSGRYDCEIVGVHVFR